MNLQKFMAILAITSYIGISCNNQNAQNNATHEHEQDEHEQDEHHEHGHEHEKATAVSLNNGSQWEANLETTEGVNNMASIIENFQKEDGNVEYKQLKADLENEFSLIFKNCTMTGEAHDQLHNFLLPIKGMLAKLDSDKIAVQAETIKKIQEHLADYPKYFK